MYRVRCLIGLLITPDEIVVYRDTYTSLSEQSVRRVGTFPAPKDWAVFKSPHHGSERSAGVNGDLELLFEEHVKSWLEHLRSSSLDGVRGIPEETREALVDYVVPALHQGTVQAVGPREVNVESN
jgi:hypothetical protein